MSVMKNIGKGFDALGSVGGLVGDGLNMLTDSTGIIKEKINSSIEEEKMDQAKQRILAKAAAIKEISKALGISAIEAQQLLEQEMEREQITQINALY